MTECPVKSTVAMNLRQSDESNVVIIICIQSVYDVVVQEKWSYLVDRRIVNSLLLDHKKIMMIVVFNRPRKSRLLIFLTISSKSVFQVARIKIVEKLLRKIQ